MTSSVSPLLQHISFIAKCRQNDPAIPLTPKGLALYNRYVGRKLTLNNWLRIEARDLGLTYNQVSRFGKRFEKYSDFNVRRKIWNTPVRFFYQSAVFERQLQALLEASDGRVSLAQAAAKHRVCFDCFDFSLSLVEFLFAHKKSVLINFDGLRAWNCVISDFWMTVCTSFVGADLRDAKFVRFYDVRPCRSGMTIHKGQFMNANLSGADMRNAYLRGSDFTGAVMEGADLRNANTYECVFTGVKGHFLEGEYDSSEWLLENDE